MHGVCLHGVEPHTARDCALLDAVQNHAARWIVRSHWDSETLKCIKSSKDHVSNLKWPSLSTRRIFKHVYSFLMLFMGKLYLNLRTTSCCNLRSHKLSFRTISSTINSYHYSQLVNGIFLWNKIPLHILEARNSISKFKQALHRWLF